MPLRLGLVLLVSTLPMVTTALMAPGRSPWLDSTLAVDERVRLLLAVMTNAEKNAQLSYASNEVAGGDTNATLVIEAAVARGGIGR